MGRCVQLEHHLISVSALLAERGIRSAVLKGGATAHLDYPDPTWREFGDIDLLIDPANLQPARQLIENAGWDQGYPLPRWHDRFTHAVTFVRDHMELDLHQRVAHRALGLLIPSGELLDRAIVMPLGCASVRALEPVDRLVHAAVHAATAGRDASLSSLADVLVLTARHAHLAGDTLERVERWGVRATFERGLHTAFAVAGLDVPSEWMDARQLPTRRRDRLVDMAHDGGRGRRVIDELAFVALIGSWSDRLRYVGGHLAPGHDYASRHGGRGIAARWRYLRRKLRS